MTSSEVRRLAAAAVVVGVLNAFAVPPAGAQRLRLASVEAETGHAGFVDEAWDHRLMLGAVGRLALTPRLTIGPEVVYLDGRHGAHDLTVTASATFDLGPARSGRTVVPFIAIGVGLIRQTSLVGGGPGTTGLFPYASSEGTVSGGVGARIALGRGLFVAPDVRLGWEPETRVTVALGWRR